MGDESPFKELKKKYSEIEIKHQLPSFEQLNRDFSIEKLSDSETDFLIREVRKLVAEKLSNYLRFIEMLLQPTNVPMSIFSMIKTLGADEKGILTKIYKSLVRFEIFLIDVDVEFNEEKEAKFIREGFKEWQLIKQDLMKIIGTIEANLDNKLESNGRGYFG